MPDARLEKVRADPVAADRLLEQARVHLASAQLEGLDRESAYGICYQAALKGLVGVLLAGGLRVTGGAGGHVVTIREGAAILALGPGTTDRLQRMRRGRNNVFYGSLEISQTDLTAALADAESVLEAAARRERS